MSLNLYLDDCAYAKELVRQLEAAGHTVVIPAAMGTTGASDSVHFKCACNNGWVILTKNPGDFEILGRAEPAHAGVFAVCQDNDPERDMNYSEIVRSIANIENAGVPIAGQFHILNHWRY